jgi:prevent-host-death family protein
MANPKEAPVKVTATEAKNRFGSLSAQAKRGPVVVHKAGKPDTVILSYEDYQRLAAPQATLAARRKWFNETYKDWIEQQNRFVEQYGVFGEDHRPW